MICATGGCGCLRVMCSLKGIQTIQHVQLDDSTLWTAGGPGTVTPLLQAAVEQLQVDTDMGAWLGQQAT